MAQEIAQTGQPNVQTQTYQEEVRKIATDLLKKLLGNIERLYDKLVVTEANIGRIVESGYWGVFEDIERAEKSVKDALVELNGTLIDLGVNPTSASSTAEEVVVEEEEKKSERVAEMIYNVFGDLADIYNRDIMFLLEYLLDHKLYNAYGGVDRTRRALWGALLSLVDALYLTSC